MRLAGLALGQREEFVVKNEFCPGDRVERQVHLAGLGGKPDMVAVAPESRPRNRLRAARRGIERAQIDRASNPAKRS